MQVSWLWAWCAIVRRATGGFQQFLGSMRHVSSRWCRFSSCHRAGANFQRKPCHAYAQECQAQATSSENSKGRLPDRDVRPMKRYSTLAGGRAVMRSSAAVAATTKILTSGLTKIKLTLATAVQGCFFPRSVTQNVYVNVNLFTRSESTVSAMVSSRCGYEGGLLRTRTPEYRCV